MDLNEAKSLLTEIAEEVDIQTRKVFQDQFIRLLQDGDMSAPVVTTPAELDRLKAINTVGKLRIKNFLIEHLTIEEIGELAGGYLIRMTELKRLFNKRQQSLFKSEEKNAVQNWELQEKRQEIRDLPQVLRRKQAQKASARGRAAANALHSKPGNSRDKQGAIRAAWASGKYSNRDLCAEQECAALDMAIGTARRALRNTPEPLRRCTA